jgi:membrane protein implicated in regulation of membrane protease activity
MGFYGWLILGVVLLLTEAFFTRFIFLFFALSAVLIGGLKYMGALNGVMIEAAVFVALGFALMVGLRGSLSKLRDNLKARFSGNSSNSSKSKDLKNPKGF